jgi:hypothetical protein
MPVHTDPLVLGLTWSALLLATTLYGLLVRRRAIDRRRVASEMRDVGSALLDSLSRMRVAPTHAAAAGAAEERQGHDHVDAGDADSIEGLPTDRGWHARLQSVARLQAQLPGDR